MKIGRRSFLMGAGSLAAFTLTPMRMLSAQSGGSTSLLAFADMEVNEFEDYQAPANPAWLRLSPSGNSPTISTTVSRSGNKSARLYVNRQTSSNSFRTEFTTTGSASDGHDRSMQFGKTYWHGFSLYVPADWRSDSTTGEVLYQIHNRPLDWANSMTPMLSIRMSPNSDRWRFRVLHTSVPEGDATPSDLIHAVDDRTQRISTGTWTDFVIEYRPDWRAIEDGGVGLTRIWMNGDKVVDYSGPNAYNETNGPYLKLGCYKSSWKNRDLDDPVVDRLYYLDEFRMSRPDVGSYELVAPAGVAGAAPPRPPSTAVE